jgi:hypothetical protein
LRTTHKVLAFVLFTPGVVVVVVNLLDDWSTENTCHASAHSIAAGVGALTRDAHFRR